MNSQEFAKSIRKLSRQYRRDIFLWAVILVCGVGLLWLSGLGQYIRPFQDDFYYYPPISSQEMFDLLHERFHWTGRFSTTTFHLAIGWLQLHWIVPLISLILMVLGIFAFSKVLFSNFFVLKPKDVTKFALLSGVGLTVILFLVTPSPYSSIFWLSGAPIHFWSYGLVLLFMAYVLKLLLTQERSLRWYDYLLMIVVPAIVGMFGEIAMFTLLAFICVVAVAAYMYRSRKVLLIALCSFVGVAVAFYELFFSLGAVIRRGAEQGAPLGEVAAHAPYVIAKNIYALLTSLMNNRILLLVVLLSAFVVGMLYVKRVQNYRKTWGYLIGIGLILFGIVCLNFIAVYSSVRFNIAWSRTQTFSVLVLISVLTVYGIVLGAMLREKLSSRWIKRVVYSIAAFIVLVMVMNIGFIPYVQTFASSIQARAETYDEREKYIQLIKNNPAHITCPIEVPSTYLWGTQETFDLVDDPAHALNQGVKRYYRLPCDVSGT